MKKFIVLMALVLCAQFTQEAKASCSEEYVKTLTKMNGGQGHYQGVKKLGIDAALVAPGVTLAFTVASVGGWGFIGTAPVLMAYNAYEFKMLKYALIIEAANKQHDAYNNISYRRIKRILERKTDRDLSDAEVLAAVAAADADAAYCQDEDGSRNLDVHVRTFANTTLAYLQ